MLLDSVTCPLLIRSISLMQVIWKAQSSSMSLKSAARRVWFTRATELTLAIVNGPYRSRVAQLEQEGNDAVKCVCGNLSTETLPFPCTSFSWQATPITSCAGPPGTRACFSCACFLSAMFLVPSDHQHEFFFLITGAIRAAVNPRTYNSPLRRPTAGHPLMGTVTPWP